LAWQAVTASSQMTVSVEAKKQVVSSDDIVKSVSVHELVQTVVVVGPVVVVVVVDVVVVVMVVVVAQESTTSMRQT